MSAAAHTTRKVVTDRTAHTSRRVVVPDRMIVKADKGIAPMINKQSSVASLNAANVNKPANLRHQPIESTKVHKTIQKDVSKHPARPVKRATETPGKNEMSTLLERHKKLPRHLARTASRAHLLSQLVQPEPEKLRWHQKILAGIMS